MAEDLAFQYLIFSNVSPVSKLDDSVVAKELTISDSEHSDAEVSYTENGMFNLSRGQTPLTEGSEGERKLAAPQRCGMLSRHRCDRLEGGHAFPSVPEV